MNSSCYPVLPESFWQLPGFRASALPGISALRRQKMSRINFIDCRFFAFLDALSPQGLIADVYSRTAKTGMNDISKWCELHRCQPE